MSRPDQRDIHVAEGSPLAASASGSSYSLRWWIFDLLDDLAERVIPRSSAAVVPALMLAPAVLLVGILAYGFVLIMDQSLHVLDPQTFTLRPELSFGNFSTVFSRDQYRQFILRTIWTGLLVGLISIALAFPYAYALVRTRSERLKKILLICALLPFLLGAVIRGFAWLLILGRSGLVNSVLGHFGMGPVPLIYNFTGVLIGLVQLNIPLAVIILVPALTAIHEQVEEAAQSLGAHWLRVMRTIVLPLSVPGIAGAFLLIFTLTFSEMVIPTMLGGGRTDLIANAIYKSYVTAADTGTGAALCVMTTFAVIFAVVLFYAVRSILTKVRA